jgi:hypothetical protein
VIPVVVGCSWNPPQDDVYKINSYCSFDPNKRIGGYRFVVRNMNGEVLCGWDWEHFLCFFSFAY